ncbi:putative E2 ubiquitin-conjugating enzyme [Microsporum audouinii]
MATALREHPDDIKQSVHAVKTFLAARLAVKCHSCRSNITDNFCVRDWMRRWSEGAQGNPKKGCYLCAATCSSCKALTCLGCGRKVRQSKNPHEIEGYYIDWCCRDGRLFGIWLLLARYDRVEIRWQASSSTTENAYTLARDKNGESSRKTQDSRGIGYADNSRIRYSPFATLFYDGPGSPSVSLNRPLQFRGSDEREDEFVGKVFDFVGRMIPGPANKNLPSELHAHQFQIQTQLLLYPIHPLKPPLPTMTKTKKPNGQAADAPPSLFVYTPPNSPSHERKCALEDEPMVMDAFLSSAKPDDTSNSDGSTPPTPRPIGEIPQKPGEGPLAGLKDLLMEVLQELKVGPTVVQSEETPAPKPKPAIAPLGSKLEFKRVEQVYGPFFRTPLPS